MNDQKSPDDSIDADPDDQPWTVRDGTIHVDRRPEGDRQQASQTYSGEVFTEYGIVDLRSAFPSMSYDWHPEHPPDSVDDAAVDALAATDPDFDPDDAGLLDVGARTVEHHVVAPFRVVKRGLKDRAAARNTAERMNEDEAGDSDRFPYFPVMLSDTRGL